MKERNTNNKLKGRIIEECGTMAEFEKKTGFSHRKASYIVNRKQEATAKDIERMSTVLNVSIPEDMKALFF